MPRAILATVATLLGAACGPSTSVVAQDAASVDGVADAGVDALVLGDGAYLDRCTAASDCATGLCAFDVGDTLFCTRTCAADTECADEHVCAAGVCVPDDTGAPCSVASPEDCALGLCLGSGDGSAFCTKECQNASACPAGYACTSAGGSANPICVNIERACVDGNSCGSGLCLTVQGCTAFCRNAGDCPARLAGLPPYTCEIAFGSPQPICVPPSDILGPDPIGASCPATGTNTCRSDACDTAATGGPMCTQTCSAEAGCGPGFGCFPLTDGMTVELVCNRAGSGDFGEPCNAAADCHSGLCDANNFCTRLCTDGLCPTGFDCEPLPIAGATDSICR